MLSKFDLSALTQFIKRISDIELFDESETRVDLENTEDQVFEPISPVIPLQSQGDQSRNIELDNSTYIPIRTTNYARKRSHHRRK